MQLLFICTGTENARHSMRPQTKNGMAIHVQLTELNELYKTGNLLN